MNQLNIYIVTYYDGNGYEVMKFVALSFNDALAVMSEVVDTSDVNSIIEISDSFEGPKFRTWIDGEEENL